MRGEDSDHAYKGVFYTDGSRLMNQHADTVRLGWSFVVFGDRGQVLAIAGGSPPSYITDIPGAEAWALVQAARVALLGSCFRSDCKPCVDEIHAG